MGEFTKVWKIERRQLTRPITYDDLADDLFEEGTQENQTTLTEGDKKLVEETNSLSETDKLCVYLSLGREKLVKDLTGAPKSKNVLTTQTSTGWYPIHYAAAFGHYKPFVFLAEKLKDLNVQTGVEWYTALHLALLYDQSNRKGHENLDKTDNKDQGTSYATTGGATLTKFNPNPIPRHDRLDSTDDNDNIPESQHNVLDEEKDKWNKDHSITTTIPVELRDQLRKLLSKDRNTTEHTNAGFDGGHECFSIEMDENEIADEPESDRLLQKLQNVPTADGHKYIIEYLRRNEARNDIKDFHQQTALQLAVQRGHEYAYHCLWKTLFANDKVDDIVLTQCAPIINEHILEGWAPIHIAAACGAHAALERLVENHGADINTRTKDKHESTVAHIAIDDEPEFSQKILREKLAKLKVTLPKIAGQTVALRRSRGLTSVWNIPTDRFKKTLAFIMDHSDFNELQEDRNHKKSALDIVLERHEKYKGFIKMEDKAKLVQAIAAGDNNAIVDVLISNRTLWDSCFCYGWAPIHLAAAMANTMIVQQLLSPLPAIIGKNDNGRRRQIFRRTGMDQQPVDNRPPADLANLATKDNGSTALHIISTTNSFASAKPHMEKFLKVTTTTTPLRKKPPTKAAKTDVISLLLRHGFDPEKPRKDGKTALQLAIESGLNNAFPGADFDLQVLLKAIADRELDTLEHMLNDTKTCICLALSLQVVDGWTPIHLAVALGDLDMLGLLLRNRVDGMRNNPAADGKMPLHLAVMRPDETLDKAKEKLAKYFGNKDNTQFPIVELASKNTQQEHESDAIIQKKNEMIELLLDSEEDINGLDSDRNTVLHIAVHQQQDDAKLIEVVNIIVEKAKDQIDLANKVGVTPLQTAVELAKGGIAKILVNKGANFSKKAKYGQQNRDAVEVMYLSQEDLALLEKLEQDLQHKAAGRWIHHLGDLVLLGIQHNDDKNVKRILEKMRKFEDEQTEKDNVDGKNPTSDIQGKLLRQAVKNCNLKLTETIVDHSVEPLKKKDFVLELLSIATEKNDFKMMTFLWDQTSKICSKKKKVPTATLR